MPNNFKLRGDYYVSKAGNDANDGLTPETPKLTVQAGLDLITTTGRTLVIGAGVYRESISRNFALITTNIVADGCVIMEGYGFNSFTITMTNSSTVNLFGIEFRNYLSLDYTATGGTLVVNYTNCIFKNNIVVSYGTLSLFFTSCQFINSALKFSSGISPQLINLYYDKCVLINSSQDASESLSGAFGNLSQSRYNATVSFKNCYVDPNSLIRFKSTSNNTTGVLDTGQTFTNSANVINNNIQGRIVFSWSGSVSGINTFNVPISYAQAKIDYPTYFFNSVSADPKFNNPRLLDFTLQSGSPHINASSDYTSNIGGTGYAISVSASAAEWTTNASVTDLEFIGTNSYAVSSSVVSGSITSAPIFIQWPRLRPLTNLFYNGDLQFNKSITAGGSGNTNVPDWNTFTSASATTGSNPDRLTIKMRYSTQETQPVTDSEWDNGGYWLSGSYEIFEINTKPKVDVYGKGNGNPEYVEYTGLGDLVPSWIQLKIQLINNYI